MKRQPYFRRHWFAIALVFGFPVYDFLESGSSRTCAPLMPGIIPTATAALPVRVGPAPEWSLEKPEGGTISSTDFAGKAVILNFWGTWCPPCVEEIPALVRLQSEFADRDLAVIGIAAEPNSAALASFVKEAGINYPVALADRDTLSAYGNVRVFPTTFFIDREGNIRSYIEGPLDFEKFKQAAESILD